MENMRQITQNWNKSTRLPTFQGALYYVYDEFNVNA